MLTPTALSKFRDFIKKKVSYGRYRVGSTFYTVPIHEVVIEGDKVYVYLLIDHNAAGTVNRCQLFDVSNELFADKTDISIAKDDTQGVLVRFSFLIQEV
ncbi:MAG: hypothetical protein U1D96_05455 [Eubacteriales bacterium]|nr:hypothetical protein [Clostridia bacterium]MDZ4042927.1 hypothetical protein [Eubacteriales bacterium]